MKNILGLDLGTNSIGWALIQQDFESKQGKILGMGSRIIPMTQDIKDEFGKGNSISQTADRTNFRGVRRLRERHLLRRERLHRVLNVIGFLPDHYAKQIDFENRFGKFINETEPKLVYDNKEFIFKNSFEEMLEDFKENQPELLNRKNRKGEDAKIPYDWTIYYLRKKALSQKIESEELAWIILNFNQKRGYYQLRGEEEEENPNKLVEFHSLKIVAIEADEETNKKGQTWYSLHLENGWIYRRSGKTDLSDWKGKIRDFIVTTDLNDDGTVKTDKEGDEKRSFRAPGEDDWTLIKKKTEKEIDKSKNTVGTYIYETLLRNPKQKINGELIRTIERGFYKEELKSILETQRKFHPALQNEDLYHACVKELYRNNEAHQAALDDRDLGHLFVEDIIFYQRPLRSQKSSIGNCSLEFRKYQINGEEKTEYLKAIPKSHPLYQEFRLWQWVYNLSIYTTDDDINVTQEFLKTLEDYEVLFEFLNSRKEVDQKSLLKHFKLTDRTHRWNFVKDKKYPCNETRLQILTRLSKFETNAEVFLTPEIEHHLWHIIYSVTDKLDFQKALNTFANNYGLNSELFVENFKRFPPYKSDYGTYSAKAIKKILPLMRLGKYWDWNVIDDRTRNRIDKVLTGEFDEAMKDRVRKKSIHLTEPEHFQGLQLWLASYIVYDRHSEAALAGKWNSVADLEAYLREFRQHSMRNPIVEQVVTETLRVVKDLWVQYGNGAKDFFDEIHVELGREMKNTKEDRERLSKIIFQNENTNLRIKALLAEMLNESYAENVRPFSPIQQEILKIYEEGVLNSNIEIPEEIQKISKAAQPSSGQLQRYKLWLEQKYRSPYTGRIIPMNRLFTTDYEIEHIIPQSRYFDDSLSNKVICESAVNRLKDSQLGLSFIKRHHGELVQLGLGKTVRIYEEQEYEEFVKEHYAKSYSKRQKLMLEEIPEKMIERQLNDTRYISKFITAVLSNIVRSDINDDGVNSKNVIPGNGKITSTLRKDWGLNDVWNELILSRFERMNEITNSSAFTAYNERLQKYLPTVPIEFSKGFQKKRIDHRHHALDALIVACATRDHVNLLNNKHARSKERFDLNRKLRDFQKAGYTNPHTGNRIEREVPKSFLKPWENFTVEVRDSIEKIVVSFKQNLRVINKTSNKYEKWVWSHGIKQKELVPQTKGDSWAVRKPMHKDFVYGKVDLPRIKTPKGKLITAIRKNLDTTFDDMRIDSITDTGIQKILRNHLNLYQGKVDEKGKTISAETLGFTPEGIEELNNNIVQLNDGRFHQPIYKVRVFEIGSRFSLGQSGNKSAKFVETAKGTNLFFAVYQDNNGKRNYETISLNIVIERQKQGLISVPEINEKGGQLLFYLSPNDLVYVPNEEEQANLNKVDFRKLEKAQFGNIYKIVSSSGAQCFFIKHDVATTIVNKNEYSALNKMERAIDGRMIKEICVKLQVDRLGNIKPLGDSSYSSSFQKIHL